MHEDRYFVDSRVGCIAVRDRDNTDRDYPGLHHDTKGVTHYWSGVNTPEGWTVPAEFAEAARLTCDCLNRAKR